MALTSGTATDLPTLLESFITFAVAQGWTAYRFGAASGDPVQFSRLSEDGTFTHYYNMYQGVTSQSLITWTGIIISSSTGSDTGLAWNNQPGKHPYIGGASSISSSNIEYFFFSDGFSVGMALKKAYVGITVDVWALAAIGFHKNTRSAFGSTGYSGDSTYRGHVPLGSNGNTRYIDGATQLYSDADGAWLQSGEYSGVGVLPGYHTSYNMTGGSPTGVYGYPCSAALGGLGSDSILGVPILSPHRIVKNSVDGYRTLDSVSEFTYFLNTNKLPDGTEVTASGETYVCFSILRDFVWNNYPFDLGLAFKTS